MIFRLWDSVSGLSDEALKTSIDPLKRRAVSRNERPINPKGRRRKTKISISVSLMSTSAGFETYSNDCNMIRMPNVIVPWSIVFKKELKDKATCIHWLFFQVSP